MRLFAAVVFGKLISKFSKYLKLGGGSAAPGLIALKIEPDLVKKLSKKITKNIIITGTNGKTTTARLISHFAFANNLKIIRNHTGSNLERGIASTLITDSSLHPEGVNINYDLGIWELDEAAFNTVALKINPDTIVFLNVFRDQLDRYGEINSVLNRWCKTLSRLNSKTSIFINGDDANLHKLKSSFKGRVQEFGVENYKISGESIKHFSEIENLDFEAKNVKLDGLKGSVFELKIANYKLKIELPLPGVYHIYDALAAFAVGNKLSISPQTMVSSLKSYSPAFGRFEKFEWTPRGWRHKLSGYIFLIKNPAGATQVFQTITPELKAEDVLLLALNDNIADGEDVSWIWDAEFEKLKVQSARFAREARREKLKVVCSGTRAYDLALRLKYAGFDTNNISIEPRLENALKRSREDLKGHLYILPTYTAMLELQKILTKSGIKKNYWESD